jgi:D-aminopeptidase
MADACALIEERVEQALGRHNWPAPYVPASPVTFKVELAAPDHAQRFYGRTGVELVGPRTVVSRGQTFWQAWDQFWYGQ